MVSAHKFLMPEPHARWQLDRTPRVRRLREANPGDVARSKKRSLRARVIGQFISDARGSFRRQGPRRSRKSVLDRRKALVVFRLRTSLRPENNCNPRLVDRLTNCLVLVLHRKTKTTHLQHHCLTRSNRRVTACAACPNRYILDLRCSSQR